MKFRLVYKGPIKTYPKQRANHINDIRLAFSDQLKRLLEIPPYSMLKKYIGGANTKLSQRKDIVKRISGIRFVPIINPELNLLAELDILLLHPEILGTARADIDNRMKTLFDGLRRPQTSQEVTDNLREKAKGKTIYTLLDDDKMITKVTVNTSHMLEMVDGPDMVMLVIAVNIRASKGTPENLQLIL